MFNKEDDDYLNATKDAQIYTAVETKSYNKKLVVMNFLLVGLVGYFIFNYLKSNTQLFSSESSSLPVSEQAVLGISKTVDDEISDEQFMEILKVTEVDMLEDSMKVLVNEVSIKSPTSYTKAISRELEGKDTFKGRIVVVKKGDTLSSLSEKYYGNPMKFAKIINANKNLDNTSSFLKIGQKINIPY